MRLLLPLLALLTLSAAAEVPAYRDDRSDPVALIASYYNAISRQEYARAWSYFGDTPPVADFATFAAGHAGTGAIELLTGPVVSEGAAGSIYSTVPVAIAAETAEGARVFAGCYRLRQIQPAIQDPPFRPLFIESAKLHAAKGPLAGALPAECGE